MAAVARVANQPVQQQQPATTPSTLAGIIKKISEVVLSRWTIVVESAQAERACCGVVVGLGVASIGDQSAAFA